MMRYALFALLVAVGLALPARADDTAVGNITSTKTCPAGIGMYTGGASSASVDVRGTYSATIVFRGSINGTDYFNLYSDTGASETTSTGTFYFSVAGIPFLCVGASSYTSGTAAIRLVASSGTPSPSLQTVTPESSSYPIVGVPVLGWAESDGWHPLAVTATSGVLRTSGTSTVSGAAADDAAASGNPVLVGGSVVADGADPDDADAGDAVTLATDTERRLRVTTTHPNRVQCRLTTTATSSTLITGCDVPGSGKSIYITDINIMGGAALGATATAAIQYGDSGAPSTCANPVVVWDCQHPATSGCTANLTTPIKAGSNKAICIVDPTTGTKFVNISGYIAP